MTQHFVTFAGWEQRFAIGLNNFVKRTPPRSAHILYSKRFSQATLTNRQMANDLFLSGDIPCIFTEINFDEQHTCWTDIANALKDYGDNEMNSIVDISTMPREVIWYVFYNLMHKKISTQYLYHSPEKYGKPLTEDTDTPRLALKLSGISDLAKKTMLIITTGYDTERTEQVVRHFEPDKCYFAIQTGEQFENQTRNAQNHISISHDINAEIIDVNFYAPDFGEMSIKRIIDESSDNFNIILASLGPKISAVPLFRIACEYENVSLCYAPSRIISQEYSSGYKNSYTGVAFSFDNEIPQQASPSPILTDSASNPTTGTS